MSLPSHRILILKIVTATERRKSSDFYGRTGYLSELTDRLVIFVLIDISVFWKSGFEVS